MKINYKAILTLGIYLALVTVDTGFCRYYPVSLKKAVVLIDSESLNFKTVQVDTTMFFFSNVQISPSGKYLSFEADWRAPDTARCKGCGDRTNAMVLIDIENGTEEIIGNVLDYDWSPQDDNLSFIEYTEEYSPISGHNHNRGHTLWLYDAISGIREEISGAICDEYSSIDWLEYNNTLRVACLRGQDRLYNPVTGQVSEVWGYSLKVSPDGKFGFYDIMEDGAEVYDLESKRRIQLIRSANSKSTGGIIYADLLEWGKLDGETIAYVSTVTLEYINCATGRMYKVIPPSPEIDPINDLVGFRDGRPVWAKIAGDKAKLFYY